MLVVDTSILVYAADADSSWHAKSRDWLERQRFRPGAWYTTWPILYGFLRVTTHPRVHDAHTAILMREHGIRRIRTRDMDFHRFGFLEVVDPL